MGISEGKFGRSVGSALAKPAGRKFMRNVGQALLGLAVVSACSACATTSSAQQTAQQTIWPSTTVPGTIDSGSTGPVELGVSFKSDTPGAITGIRFYKSANNTGAHIGHLWSSTGALLASVTFTGETASGWQQANFSTPVNISANTVYVASYENSGHWSVNWQYFASAGHNNPPLHALQNGSGTPDGGWSTAGTFPHNSNGSNYWVDVVFKNSSATAPSISSEPASKTVAAGQTAAFSVTAGGATPLSYQWQKNGTNISGATSSSYTTAATTTADSGSSFRVVVSNTVGSATSTAATLTVTAATSALNASPTSLSFGNVNTGGSNTLSVTLTNSGNSSVTISSITPAGVAFTGSGVGPGTVLSAGQSTTLDVRFAPTAAGSATGSITVASNAANSPVSIGLTGTGVQQSVNFPVWVMPSLNRIGQTDAPGTTSTIALSGARGETVDTQVIVRGATSGLTNVNLSASVLTGPNGVTIPTSEITLYREYYISVTGTASYGGGSNPPLGSGTYPEPLIPFNDPETGSPLCSTSAVLKACNAAVSAGQNQPYWIDISLPHGASNTPPGTYTGEVSVTADQGNVTIPVTITVWNFELPMQPSELSLWTLWPPASGNTTATLARALMRNKVMGWYDATSDASTDVNNLGLNRSGLDSYYYIGIQCNGSYSYLPSSTQISSAAANFPAGLPLDFYLADELNGCTGDYAPIKTMGTSAHSASPSAKTMMTLNAPDPNLYNEGDGRSAIDHWVLLDSMQQWPALPFSGGGSDLWSYTSCNAGYGNTPEWMVDYPPINERIQAGFLNWTEGAKGILYYRADGWTAGNAIGSWNNVDTTACGGGLGRPGDGIFLYPPAPIASTESAPGIRLKAIRDGIQDYEYAHMLINLGQLSLVNSLLQPIAASWTNWTHDPNALVNARLQLGQELHLLHP